MSSNIIDFYFDYSSPYGYLASERIESIAARHGHSVVWHPILLGAIFKISGQVPLIEVPLKGDYAMRDFARSAREHQVSYHHPTRFPIGAVAASRATLWLRDHDDARVQVRTGEFVHALYRAYYILGKDITSQEVIASEAASLNLDVTALTEAMSGQALKDALRVEVDQAIATGVFGSPMMIVDGEPFWGHDRLEQLERWISHGGW